VSSVTNLRALCLFFFVFGLGLVNVPFLGLFFISGEKGSKHAPWRRVQRQPLSRCGQRRRERCFRRQPPPPWKAQVSPQPARAASAGGVGERCGSGGCSIHAGETSDSRPSKTGLLLARRVLPIPAFCSTSVSSDFSLSLARSYALSFWAASDNSVPCG
jgi:hypothetical protein